MNSSSRALLTLGLLTVPTTAQAIERQAPAAAEVRIYLQPWCNVFRVRGPVINEAASTRSADRPVPGPPELLVVKALQVVARAEESIHLHGRLERFRIWVVNGTDRGVHFSTTGYQLPMLREIVDPDGHWRPIDDTSGGACGKSRRSVQLPAGQAWSLSVPRTAGTLATWMRFRLDAPEGTIYSNVFPASIDPALLHTERGP